jgi:hypothetical protein
MRCGFSIAYCRKKGKLERCLLSLSIMWLFACFLGLWRGERSKRFWKNSARIGKNDTYTKREGRVLRKEVGVSTNHRFLDIAGICPTK